jgi:HAD superfamily hydrolase (TIGR01509 family)
MLLALIFDFDGTIAETERHGHRVAYNRAFEQLGLRWHWDPELYGELLKVAGGKERIRHYMQTSAPEMLADPNVAARIAEIHAVKAEHFNAIAGKIPLRPGVRRLVLEAKAAGLLLAIATTARLSGVEAILGRDRELFSAFDVLASGESAERKKPAPDVYLVALDRLGIRASEGIAFEDSAIGLQAANAAGLRTVVTLSDYSAHESFPGADVVVSSLGDPNERAQTIRGPEPETGIVDLAYLRSLP